MPGDANGVGDVFLHDVSTGVTTLVSIAPDGAQADGSSGAPAISDDGTVVASQSTADNIVPNDTNGANDVFLHNTTTAATIRASVASDGTEANSDSVDAAMSADGTVLVFDSYADNLVPGDTNHETDVFLHDVATGATIQASVASDGTQGDSGSYDPVVSADGAVIAYSSGSTNLVPGDTNWNADVFATRVASVNGPPTAVGFSVTVAEDTAVGTELGTVGHQTRKQIRCRLRSLWATRDRCSASEPPRGS